MNFMKVYFCGKCHHWHSTESQIGNKHFKHNIKKQNKLDIEILEPEEFI